MKQHSKKPVKKQHLRLGTKVLKNANRKPYTIYQMVPLSMTLSEL